MIALGCYAAVAGALMYLSPGAGVLIDFAPLVQMDEGDLTVSIGYRGIRSEPWTSTGGVVLPAEMRDIFFNGHDGSGHKVAKVGETAVRVFGYERDGKFYPAVRGKASSKTIPAGNLPRVTNPPQKMA